MPRKPIRHCTCRCDCHANAFGPMACAKLSRSARCGQCRKDGCKTKADIRAYVPRDTNPGGDGWPRDLDPLTGYPITR